MCISILRQAQGRLFDVTVEREILDEIQTVSSTFRQAQCDSREQLHHERLKVHLNKPVCQGTPSGINVHLDRLDVTYFST